MKPDHRSDEFEFIASGTNYLHINCLKCGKEAAIEYRGLDPVMPKIGVTCEACRIDATFKVFNPGALKGFPREPV